MNVIGKGTYGCVFKPPLAVSKQKVYDDKDVSKVFKYSEDMDMEWEENEKIHKEFDKEHKVTVVMKHYDDSVIPHEGTLPWNWVDNMTEDMINYERKICEACKWDAEECRKRYDLSQIVMEDGGIDLSSATNIKMSFFNFKNVFSDICDFFTKYHQNGCLIHRDIKPANVLIKNKNTEQNPDYKINIIDFGMSSFFADTFNKENLEILKANYLFYPPEFILVASLYSSVPKYKQKYAFEEDVSDYLVLTVYIENNRSILKNKMLRRFKKLYEYIGVSMDTTLIEKSAKEDIEESIQFLVDHLNKNKNLDEKDFESIINTIFAPLAGKCDVYGFSFVLAALYKFIDFKGNEEEEYLDIMRNMTNPNLISRMSFEQLKQKYCTNDIQTGGVIPYSSSSKRRSSILSKQSSIKSNITFKQSKRMNLDHYEYKLDFSKHVKKVNSRDFKNIQKIIRNNSFGTIDDYKILSKYSIIDPPRSISSESRRTSSQPRIPKQITTSKLRVANLSPIIEEQSSSNSMKLEGGGKKINKSSSKTKKVTSRKNHRFSEK